MVAKQSVEVTDVVEDVKELVEDATVMMEAQWTTNPKLLFATALLAGAAIGGGVTYWAVAKRVRARIQAQADADIQAVKEHYSVIHKDGKSLSELAAKYNDPEVAKVEHIIQREGYTAYEKVEPQVSNVDESSENDDNAESNVFDSEGVDTYFNMNEELDRRETYPDLPHVITAEEFNLNEADYQQSELTYFDGDDVLADAQSSPIDDVEKVVGHQNLLRFGHGSGDPNIVYVRCPALEIDFLVTHSDGKFAKEVLGFDDELSHSDRRRPRKFRLQDE